MEIAQLSSGSRYDRLLRGEFGGEDVLLTFVTEASADKVDEEEAGDDDAVARHEKRRRERKISAHAAFLRPCDLIRASLEEGQFAESSDRAVRIVVPPGTFDAVDSLLRWCYDGRCRLGEERVLETKFLVLERYAAGIPSLWALADFVQCRDLCDEILVTLRAGGLRCGRAFAALVDEATTASGTGCVAAATDDYDALLRAALDGLPLKPDRREELEDWLDYGSAEMLGALARCHGRLWGHGREQVDVADEGKEPSGNSDDDIVGALGNHLAEMTRGDRAGMVPSLFALCLSIFPTGTVGEADYATMVLDYVEDRGEVSDECIATLLGSIDFSAVSDVALAHGLVPRIGRVFPSYALVANDFVPMASAIITRCSFSGEILLGKSVFLSCGCVLSKQSIKLLFPLATYSTNTGENGGRLKSTTKRLIDCPFCKGGRNGPHSLVRSDYVHTHKEGGRVELCPGASENHIQLQSSKIHLRHADPVKSKRLRSYFERKHAKSEALGCWALSNGMEEDNILVYEKKAKRARTCLLSEDAGQFVRILNQCCCNHRDGILFQNINCPDSPVEDMFPVFAKEVGISDSDRIGFFRSRPDGSLGEQLSIGMARGITWRQLGFNLRGDLIIARLKQR